MSQNTAYSKLILNHKIMKILKKKIIKVFDKIILMLLGMTGMFVGCNKIESDCDCEYYNRPDLDSGWVAYGPGPNFYVIKGTVMNQANLQPIPNILVYPDMSYTNSDGNYSFSMYYKENQENSISLKFEDIDGKENGGEFKTKEIDIKFTDADKEKMDKCNKDGGTFVKIQNIELKKK